MELGARIRSTIESAGRVESVHLTETGPPLFVGSIFLVLIIYLGFEYVRAKFA